MEVQLVHANQQVLESYFRSWFKEVVDSKKAATARKQKKELGMARAMKKISDNDSDFLTHCWYALANVVAKASQDKKLQAIDDDLTVSRRALELTRRRARDSKMAAFSRHCEKSHQALVGTCLLGWQSAVA